MKKILTLETGWSLKRFEPIDRLDISKVDEYLKNGSEPKDRVFEIKHMPAQVYEILIGETVIENPNIHGDSSACQWVADYDWLYVNNFSWNPGEKVTYLDFQGLDTWADIYLNGNLIAEHEDVYIPRQVDVTGRLKASNRLIIHFHSPRKKYDEVQLPDYISDAHGKIKPGARTRMFGSTSHDYLGPKPCLLHIGVYDTVRVVEVDRAEIVRLHTSYDLSESLNSVSLNLEAVIEGEINTATVKFEVTAPDKRILKTDEIEVHHKSGVALINFVIYKPEIWWPLTHGHSPLYSVKAEVYLNGDCVDRITRNVGFRNIKRIGDFDFTINGLPLRIYGSNLAPADSLTNVFNAERMNTLLDLTEHSHQNCLRVWGESERLHDDFYDECDKRGILVWQDFFTAYSMYVPNSRMYDLFRQEAEYQVLRLRDHPCIWLWCGGNESFMSADYDYPGEEMMGMEIFDEIFPSICNKLDPGRYYHRTSPDGGSYANDPLEGDSHGYTHVWYVPGNYYPVFLSENNRVSAPAKRTMRRMMREEDLWPENYDGLQHKNSEQIWPEQWNKYNSNQGYWKVGNVESYYDATDLDAMLYRLGWAHGDYLRRTVERYRRGIPQEDGTGRRVTRGHLLWKLNNSCNHIFFGVIDYFLEPYIAYYSIKRAYEPVLLSFDIGNFINLWMVNDTVNTIGGKVFIRLFNPQKNCVVNQFDVPFEIASDQSRLLADCNKFGQFKRNNILHAYAVTSEGKRIAESFDYCDIERHMRFPTDGKTDICVNGDELLLQSNRYERSVELLGSSNGDEFGWLFEDNYFDLIPGQIKRVKIAGKHQKGIIKIKSYYSDSETTVEYKK